jgi:uncharacterized membrane protein SpoIIM required for sporulation
MKETNFVKQNKEKWLQSEQFIRGNQKDPEKLSTLFVQVVDDLSYSQTYYKHRSVRVYLNTLAREFFSIIYNNKKETRNRFKDFWLEELPQIVIFCRRELIISLIVFVLAAGIGVFSSISDKDFTASILGDGYVSMTLENIKKGDPMAVYKDMNQVEMFLKITFNNLMVAFRTYVFGLFMSIGTLFILIYNGVMVGSFQYFFAQHNLLATSAMTIWLHGTLEISSIVIAGGAGLTLGSGLLFPGTYSRLQAFQMSAMRSLKLMLGVAPILVTAGIIESFLTRYTEVPSFVKICLIILSAVFIIGYFVVYPWRKSKAGFERPLQEPRLQPNIAQPINFNRIKNNAEIVGDTFGFYKRNLSIILKWIFLLSFGAALAYCFLQQDPQRVQFDLFPYLVREMFFAVNLDSILKLITGILCTTIITNVVMLLLLKEKGLALTSTVRFTGFLKCLLIIGGTYYLLYLADTWGYWVFVFLFGMVLFIVFGALKKAPFGETWRLITSGFAQIMGLQFILFFTILVFLLLLSSPIIYFYTDIITLSFTEMDTWVNQLMLFLEVFIKFLAFNLLLPIVGVCMAVLYYSLLEVTTASNLKESIARINLRHLKKEGR